MSISVIASHLFLSKFSVIQIPTKSSLDSLLFPNDSRNCGSAFCPLSRSLFKVAPVRSRASPIHAAFPPRTPQRGTTNGGSQAGRSQPIPASPSENQQMATKTNPTLVLLLEPKVETKSSIFLCRVLLNSLFILCPAGEVRDMANGRSEFDFTGPLLRFRQ